MVIEVLYMKFGFLYRIFFQKIEIMYSKDEKYVLY